MTALRLIPAEEFARLRRANIPRNDRLALLADMNRANALMTIKRAGSGHVGSTLSSLDIVTWLYEAELNVAQLGRDHPDRDCYFSSKGHDAPGLYAVLFSLGWIAPEPFINLRRLAGTPGHPEVRIPGIEANTGSLGMGISKGKGMALAKRLQGRAGRIVVMTGDGELQEGQNYEAFLTAVPQGVSNLYVVVDANTVQTDKLVSQIADLGDLEAKLQAFGWTVARCDGHDFAQLDAAFRRLDAAPGRPKVLIADTIKGRGVSFMEHPHALAHEGGLYQWHSGAPDDPSFARAHAELLHGIETRLGALGVAPLRLETLAEEPAPAAGRFRTERLVEAYGQELAELGAAHPALVVLDADLSADCGLRAFEQRFPERFIEHGIAEQDMASTAGGLARQGLLPVVNSFGAFLAARANEQIYNNACEGSKIVYVCHYAGLIPAGPGGTHQSVRDIGLFGAMPGMTILQPCNAAETRQILRYAVEDAAGSCMIRLPIGPSPRRIELPEGYQLQDGRGAVLVDGTDAVVFAYGPTLLHEALTAGEQLRGIGCLARIVHMPWLNRVDLAWLLETIEDVRLVYVLEDHAPVGGLGDRILQALAGARPSLKRRVMTLGVEGYPACGTAQEALKAHRLDAGSLADRILADAQAPAPAARRAKHGRLQAAG